MKWEPLRKKYICHICRFLQTTWWQKIRLTVWPVLDGDADDDDDDDDDDDYDLFRQVCDKPLENIHTGSQSIIINERLSLFLKKHLTIEIDTLKMRSLVSKLSQYTGCLVGLAMLHQSDRVAGIRWTWNHTCMRVKSLHPIIGCWLPGNRYWDKYERTW